MFHRMFSRFPFFRLSQLSFYLLSLDVLVARVMMERNSRIVLWVSAEISRVAFVAALLFSGK